jgi:hypothetical protein
MDKQHIVDTLNEFLMEGTLRSWYATGGNPGLRWVVEPAGGISERRYTTNEIRVFLDGVFTGRAREAARW